MDICSCHCQQTVNYNPDSQMSKITSNETFYSLEFTINNAQDLTILELGYFIRRYKNVIRFSFADDAEPFNQILWNNKRFLFGSKTNIVLQIVKSKYGGGTLSYTNDFIFSSVP